MTTNVSTYKFTSPLFFRFVNIFLTFSVINLLTEKPREI